MQRLRVIAKLREPIAGSSPLMLDGILFAVHRGVRRAPTRATPVSALARSCDLMHPSRWIAHQNGVPLASAMLGEWTTDRTDLVKRRDGEDLEVLEYQVDTKSGPGRNAMIPVPLRCAREVHWDLIGRRRDVLSLCRNVPAIGSYLRHGFGVVSEWTCEATDDAEPLVRDGTSQRAIPVDWCSSFGRQDVGAVEPPYWHPGRFIARVPPFTRCKLVDSFAAV